jgi:transcriptional regulator with XRE-family HTH domain
MSELEKRYLEEWRKAKHWSQSDLAKEAGINRSVIFKIENSEQVGRYSTAVKIAKALQVEPEQILDFEPLFGPAKKENRLPQLSNSPA